MSGPSRVAVGYVCAVGGPALGEQREAVADYAKAEGIALAQIVTDRFDGFTISQVVETVRLHDARLVIVPAQARLATVRTRVTHELEPYGAACVVIGDAAASTARPQLTNATEHQSNGPVAAEAVAS